jgi:hypothetical protein
MVLAAGPLALAAGAAAAVDAQGDAALPDAPESTDQTAYVAQARTLVKEFMSRLQHELSTAMRSDGPAGAVSVCRTVAPAVAADLTAAQGWSVARTALRVRNPRNAPTLQERAVLVDFQQRSLAGEALADMEYVAVVDAGGLRYLHYMRPIPMGEVCLACHGSAVAEEVTNVLRSTYPADAATGFELGELRGAFSFVRPLNAAQ